MNKHLILDKITRLALAMFFACFFDHVKEREKFLTNKQDLARCFWCAIFE